MIRVLQGDVRERLVELADDSFDCIVTSPPYWGLRSYLPEGHTDKSREIGLEPTLTEYLDTMVDVCRELRRVLKPSGVMFLNIGDCYAQSGKGGNPEGSKWAGFVGNKDREQSAMPPSRGKLAVGFKPKDLCMVPNRLAIRLQEDGWYVRSEIIWAKKNCMPESVTDRPTSSHEKIWLLTKSPRYFYDGDMIREPDSPESHAKYAAGFKQLGKTQFAGSPTDTRNARVAAPGELAHLIGSRNARNVWTIASQPYPEAHFATFPPEIAERCIKAGCPIGGAVLDPFGGAGTTAMVADRLGRDCTLIELNADYVELIQNRIQKDAGMFAQLEAVT